MGLRLSRLGVAAVLATTDALVIRLEAGERECFLLEVTKEAAVSGNFELISENPPNPLAVVVSGADASAPLCGAAWQ